MNTLIILQYNNDNLLELSKILTLLAPINHNADVLLLGNNIIEITQEISKLNNINLIYRAELETNVMPPIEDIVHNAQEIILFKYTHIIMPSSSFSKELLPRLSILNDCHMISDVTHVENEDTMTYPIYAGNLLATQKLLDEKKFFSIRLSAITAKTQPVNTEIQQNKIIPFDLEYHQQKTTFIEFNPSVSSRPQLSTAKIVVSGGRGLKNKDNFNLIFQLADCLHAAVGASRAAVDAEYISNDFQVGQTGKIVAPELYIAIGISGAIQHMAGIKDAKKIVVINNDIDAPIIQQCDNYLINDLFTVIPQLIEKLS